MAFEYKCADCDETFREDTAAGLIKRAAAHSHEHHGGPAEINSGDRGGRQRRHARGLVRRVASRPSTMNRGSARVTAARRFAVSKAI